MYRGALIGFGAFLLLICVVVLFGLVGPYLQAIEYTGAMVGLMAVASLWFFAVLLNKIM